MVRNQLARTRFFDAKLDEALRDGARQVVVLGAGFDRRGYRFRDRLGGVRFLEVDYGPTQEHKKQRVREILGRLPSHVRYVPMDFTKDDLLTQLKKSGYSEKEKTFFIWEGVVYYLPEAAVRDTLRFVRSRSGAGSTIAFNYLLISSPSVNNPNSMYARWSEPHIFGFAGDSATSFLQAEGFTVVLDRPSSEILKMYVRQDSSSGLPLVLEGDGGVGFCVAQVPGAK
jgi:methyltransferase (TIGR00027 family)